MSQRILVSDLQSPVARIAAALNICPDDERFFAWLNQFEEMALNQGRWYGSIVEAQFCVSSTGCLTFPRQAAAIEQLAVDGWPIDIENGWYAFTRLLTNLRQCPSCASGTTGTNRTTCDCGHLQLRMKEGTVCSFDTTRGENKVIRSYPSQTADEGKTIIYQGRDKNGIWVRTTIDGVVSDGEQVTLALPFVDTVTEWAPGSPIAVVKEATQYRVLVYEYDTVTHLERALADYEPSETRPSYLSGHIAGMRRTGSGCCSAGTDPLRKRTLTALVSLQHIPLTAPTDWCILQNLSAYKAGMMAMKAYEEGDAAKGDFYFYGTQASGRNGRGVMRVVNRGGAIPLLNAELRKATGDRVTGYIYQDESDRFPRTMAGFW